MCLARLGWGLGPFKGNPIPIIKAPILGLRVLGVSLGFWVLGRNGRPGTKNPNRDMAGSLMFSINGLLPARLSCITGTLRG